MPFIVCLLGKNYIQMFLLTIGDTYGTYFPADVNNRFLK